MIDINTKIVIGGTRQRIHIKTDDTSKPVLLFLHGGPGVCNRHNIMTAHLDLLDSFTIATWDQCGSGGSALGVKDADLTIRRLTDDAAELVEWLCAHFGKDRIFVIGGSWGSVLGTWLAYRYPARIAAFVGFGQVVDGAKNEELSYGFALDAARAAGDGDSIRKLQEVGPPVRGQYKGGYGGMMVQRRVMMRYGGYSKDKGKRSYLASMVIPILASGEYSPLDLMGYITGHRRVLSIMWPEVGAVDFPATCTRFAIPFYIFDGRLDMNTPSELVQEWYDMIEAPEKDLIWFEDSGHNPMNDEPEKFKRLLREKLRAVKEREECRI